MTQLEQPVEIPTALSLPTDKPGLSHISLIHRIDHRARSRHIQHSPRRSLHILVVKVPIPIIRSTNLTPVSKSSHLRGSSSSIPIPQHELKPNLRSKIREELILIIVISNQPPHLRRTPLRRSIRRLPQDRKRTTTDPIHPIIQLNMNPLRWISSHRSSALPCLTRRIGVRRGNQRHTTSKQVPVVFQPHTLYRFSLAIFFFRSRRGRFRSATPSGGCVTHREVVVWEMRGASERGRSGTSTSYDRGGGGEKGGCAAPCLLTRYACVPLCALSQSGSSEREGCTPLLPCWPREEGKKNRT